MKCTSEIENITTNYEKRMNELNISLLTSKNELNELIVKHLAGVVGTSAPLAGKIMNGFFGIFYKPF